MVDDALKKRLVSEGLDRISEAAGFLKLSRSCVYALMDAGQLPYVRIGRARRIPHHALIEFAARNLSTTGNGGDVSDLLIG
jgi:excisionase family DNA binding protein